MFSTRLQRPVVLSAHAQVRVRERDIDAELVLEIIDSGNDRDAGNGHHWLYIAVGGRSDNLPCVAAVLDNVLVVKTAMDHWEIRI